jgi:DNA polymerase III delta subunit
MERGQIAPAYLFLGPEAYHRRRARAALLKAFENAVTQYDLAETPLAEVIDDARALSLFASERVIFAGNAEAALPRTRSDEDAEESDGPAGSADMLAAYMKRSHARRGAGLRRSAFRFRRRG